MLFLLFVLQMNRRCCAEKEIDDEDVEIDFYDKSFKKIVDGLKTFAMKIVNLERIINITEDKLVKYGVGHRYGNSNFVLDLDAYYGLKYNYSVLMVEHQRQILYNARQRIENYYGEILFNYLI